jgi:signal transduction histidine kinase/CRP-like cAMP-binding protein
MTEAGRLRELFAEFSWFTALDDTAVDNLAQKLRPLHFADGQLVCEEGDVGDWTFVVAAGEVAVLKKAADETFIQVNVLGRGDWGGMMSLFENAPRSARLVARGDVELLALFDEDLVRLLEDTPGLSTGIIGLMSRRLRADAVNLAATLRYLNVTGLDVYKDCSPEERLLLDAINHRVGAGESLEAIMDFLFNSFRRLGKCDRMTLAFIEDGGSRITSHWTRATYEPLKLPSDYSQVTSTSSLAQVLETGQPRIINDLEHYLRHHPASRATRLILEEGIQSSMTCPLIVDRRPVGFLFHSAREKNAYDEHQVRLQLAVVESISQAVEKTYRIEQLTRANNDYSELLAFVSHELQSPLAAMVTDAQLIIDGYLGPLNDQQRDKLERSIKKGKYLLSLVRDYLNLARVEDRSLRLDVREDVDLCQEVLDPSIGMIEAEAASKRMSIERDYATPSPRADCDVSLMRIAMGNLLRNAAKYGREEGVIRVSATADEQMVELSVWNEGLGFSKSQRAKLFRKFSRLDSPASRQEKGTGVGLYSTWRAVQAHHGRVSADSAEGDWANFSVTLPRHQPSQPPST